MISCDNCDFIPMRLMTPQDPVECKNSHELGTRTLCRRHPDISDRWRKRKLTYEEWSKGNLFGSTIRPGPGYDAIPMSQSLIELCREVWNIAQDNK